MYELCDYIALINKSQKILDGSVVDIKSSYKNQTYSIVYQAKSGVALQFNPALFEVIDQSATHEEQVMTVRTDNQTSLNELLLFLIPQIDILQVREIVPSMHDIFIDKVTTNANHTLS